MKRFIETKMWDDNWFQDLSPVNKCLWLYICSKADNAGVWKRNESLAEFQIGAKIDFQSALLKLNEGKERVRVLTTGDWYIVDFIAFQIGNLSGGTLTNLQKSCKSLLTTYEEKGISLGVSLTGKLPVAMGYKYKGKDKGNGKDKGKDNKAESSNRAPAACNTTYTFCLENLPAEIRQPEVLAELNHFAAARRAIKKPLDAHKADLLLRRLVALTAESSDKLRDAVEIIRQSVANNWQGFYPLKADHVYITPSTRDRLTPEQQSALDRVNKQRAESIRRREAEEAAFKALPDAEKARRMSRGLAAISELETWVKKRDAESAIKTSGGKEGKNEQI